MTTPVYLPNVYSIIVQYANTDNVDLRWRNTYDIFAAAAPAPGDAVVDAIGAMALAMAHDDTTLESITCYNWARGTVPYPTGTALWVKTIGVVCTAEADWGSVISGYVPGDKSLCLRIDHQPSTSGKPGRNFIRGLLGTNDVSSVTGGKWILGHPASEWETALLVILVDANIPQYFSGGSSAIKFVTVRYSPKTNTVHGYTVEAGWTVIGATTAKGNRKSVR